MNATAMLNTVATNVVDETVDVAPLDWDKMVEQLDNYCKYAASKTFRQNPYTNYLPEDLYQEGMLLMFKVYQMYNGKKPLDDVCRIYRSAIWRRMIDLMSKKQHVTLSSDDENEQDADLNTMVAPDSMEDDLEFADSFACMEHVLQNCPASLAILNELNKPSAGVIKLATDEYNAQRGGKYKMASIQVQHKHVQQYLGLSTEQWRACINRVKYVTEVVMIQGRRHPVINPRSHSVDSWNSEFAKRYWGNNG